MTSQKSTEELLDIFETLDHPELKEKTEEFLPALIRSLSVEDESCLTVKVLRLLLHSCLPVIRIQNVEKEIFQHALPALKHMFLETLNGINFRLLSGEIIPLEEVADDLDGLLKVCLILLDCVDSTLQYVISSSQVNASEIPSLSKNVADILLYSFKHCKESEKLYGNFFQPLSETLSLLFKRSHAIQGFFIAALTSNIKYECSFEEDLVDLIYVLEVMEEIAEVVTGLDIKTMANQWKFYAKILQEHVANLRQRLDISRTIKFLSIDLRKGLKAVLESDMSDSKSVIRNLKLLNFTLKILMLLCETFAGCLGDCHKDLLHLLLYMLSNSHPYLQIMQIQTAIIDAVESYVIIGVEPLVLRLMEDRALAQEYFLFNQSIDEEECMKLGFLLLSAMLMKNILPCDDAIRQIWLQNDLSENLISVVFQTLRYCHLELTQNFQLKGSCRSPTAGGSGATHGVYESLFIHMSALITTIPADKMPLVEQTLLHNILNRNGNIWQALLAADVWCMIARCGTAELCYKHVYQLAILVVNMLHDRSCPEVSHMRMVLHRLFSLLSNKGMVQICEKFPPVSNPRLWQIFGIRKLPEQLRMRLRSDLINKSIKEIEKFTSNPSSIQQYDDMMDAVVGASVALDCIPLDKNEDLVLRYASKITKVWASVCPSKFSLECITSQRWLGKCLNDLTSATICIAPVLSNVNILQVLRVYMNEKFQSLSSIKLASLKFLRSLATVFFDSDQHQSNVWQQIAKIFSLLMQDKNAIIREMSLENFVYFSQVTKHEQIVSMSVGGSLRIKDAVANFLKKIPHGVPPGEQITFHDYLKKQSILEPSHVCRQLELKNSSSHPMSMKSSQFVGQKSEQNGHQRNGDDARNKASDDADSCITNEIEVDFKSKKRKLDDNRYSVIKRMKEDVNYIVKELENELLPNEIKTEIQEMIGQLQSLVS